MHRRQGRIAFGPLLLLLSIAIAIAIDIATAMSSSHLVVSVSAFSQTPMMALVPRRGSRRPRNIIRSKAETNLKLARDKEEVHSNLNHLLCVDLTLSFLLPIAIAIAIVFTILPAADASAMIMTPMPTAITTIVISSTSHTLSADASSDNTLVRSNEWNFDSGSVSFPQIGNNRPLVINDKLKLQNPVLLGNGGGGAVFCMQNTFDNALMVVKISWEKSADSVRNECQILNILEEHHVSGVEQCLAQVPYYHYHDASTSNSNSNNRVMIVMTPVLEGPFVNSISELDSISKQQLAVKQVIQTFLEMLLTAHVVTTDVQPLIVASSGQVLLIDMTEAKQISNPPTTLDLALASSFISEILALIPTTTGTLQTYASTVMAEELQRLVAARQRHASSTTSTTSVTNNAPPVEVIDLLKDQVSFLNNNKDATRYLDQLIP